MAPGRTRKATASSHSSPVASLIFLALDYVDQRKYPPERRVETSEVSFVALMSACERPSVLAASRITIRILGIGNQMALEGKLSKVTGKTTIPRMLKKKWQKASLSWSKPPRQVAICKLSGFSSAKAARIAVNVVPMLAPSVNGNILCEGSTSKRFKKIEKDCKS